MKILVVDDSSVFRSRIKEALAGISEIDLVAAAPNGKIALDKLLSNNFDLVTLDMEMPELNGLETLQKIKEYKLPTRVIVFASNTRRGAEMALEALKLGAVDFVAKPHANAGEDAATLIKRVLVPKILQFAAGLKVKTITAKPKSSFDEFYPQAIVIGSSTGGPPALELLFESIRWPKVFCPIFIVQHMPAGGFTSSLAQRLSRIANITVLEARQWQTVTSSQVYIAPGDFHMALHADGSDLRIKIDQGAQVNEVRPAVDVLLKTAGPIYKNRLMVCILTGMGSDGLNGLIEIKKFSPKVCIQDQESSVVWGMPGSISQANLHDYVGNIKDIARTITKVITTREEQFRFL